MTDGSLPQVSLVVLGSRQDRGSNQELTSARPNPEVGTSVGTCPTKQMGALPVQIKRIGKQNHLIHRGSVTVGLAYRLPQRKHMQFPQKVAMNLVRVAALEAEAVDDHLIRSKFPTTDRWNHAG